MPKKINILKAIFLTIYFSFIFPDEITASFRRYGPLIVDWPHKAESKSYFPPKGYAFLLFQVCFYRSKLNINVYIYVHIYVHSISTSSSWTVKEFILLLVEIKLSIVCYYVVCLYAYTISLIDAIKMLMGSERGKNEGGFNFG